MCITVEIIPNNAEIRNSVLIWENPTLRNEFVKLPVETDRIE